MDWKTYLKITFLLSISSLMCSCNDNQSNKNNIDSIIVNQYESEIDHTTSLNSEITSQYKFTENNNILNSDPITDCINDTIKRNSNINIRNTATIDIDFDGITEILILFSTDKNELSCYKVVDNTIIFCGNDGWGRIDCDYNSNIFDPISDINYYDSIQTYEFLNDKVIVSSYYNSGSQYNYISKLRIENQTIKIVPIFCWGRDKLFTNQGFVYPPVYKEIDENGDETDITPEELQNELDKIKGIELNCISDCFYRIDKDIGKVSMTAKELEEFLQEYYYN